jgi:hypothetical protein
LNYFEQIDNVDKRNSCWRLQWPYGTFSIVEKGHCHSSPFSSEAPIHVMGGSYDVWYINNISSLICAIKKRPCCDKWQYCCDMLYAIFFHPLWYMIYNISKAVIYDIWNTKSCDMCFGKSLSGFQCKAVCCFIPKVHNRLNMHLLHFKYSHFCGVDALPKIVNKHSCSIYLPWYYTITINCPFLKPLALLIIFRIFNSISFL